jgi:hypothetical protein
MTDKHEGGNEIGKITIFATSIVNTGSGKKSSAHGESRAGNVMKSRISTVQ